MMHSFVFAQDMGNTQVPMPAGPPGLQLNRIHMHRKRAVRSGPL